jgi:hypothetical protein
MWKSTMLNFVQQNRRKLATAASVAGVGLVMTTQVMGSQPSQTVSQCGCVSSCCSVAAPVQSVPVIDSSLSGTCPLVAQQQLLAAGGAPASVNISYNYNSGSESSSVNIALSGEDLGTVSITPETVSITPEVVGDPVDIAVIETGDEPADTTVTDNPADEPADTTVTDNPADEPADTTVTDNPADEPANESQDNPTHGNNGVGNGEDPQPPGNPPVNDGPGTGPGNPGNQGGGNGNGSGQNNENGQDTKGNNGVGNGVDPQPPGDPPVNDGQGTGPGNPGNQGGGNGNGNGNGKEHSQYTSTKGNKGTDSLPTNDGLSISSLNLSNQGGVEVDNTLSIQGGTPSDLWQ